jgi:succinate dehydrogenase/fumarate reductase flavoprotein subunit
VSSRAAKNVCDEGRGVGESGLAVYLDFAESIQRLGLDTVKARYGNLFDMYHHITAEDPYQQPMRIYPAVHYTMGGLWVDYNLMTTVPWPFRARRSQLLRSRCQSPRRFGTNARLGRRLFRDSLHHRQLFGWHAADQNLD